MTARLEIALKPKLLDPKGEKIRRRAKDYFGYELESVRIVNILTVDSRLKEEQLEEVRKTIFTNPVTQISSFEPIGNFFDWDWAIWVGYRPGVMDPEGHTAVEAIEDKLKIKFKREEAVYTSKLYLIKSKLGIPLNRNDADRLAREMLANDTIQHYKVIHREEWNPQEGTGIIIPKVILKHKPTVTTISISSDDELLRVSNERNLALNPRDVPVIRKYFLRPEIILERKQIGLDADPTDVELEYIAQARSDHCNHNTFNGKFFYKDRLTGEELVIENLFEECIKKPTLELAAGTDWVISVLWDNCGIGKYDEHYNYAISAETHNSPSNIEPYGGAITGNVGEYRDKLGGGKGSKVAIGLFCFCVGPRDYSGDLKPKLHPRRLLDGVIEGVRDGGNKSGVPTSFGNVLFDPCWLGKCLVFVGSVGIMPSEINGEPTYKKTIKNGDLCIMAGGRVGKDGIHGVTVASEEYTEHTPAGHVQIGSPYTQKKMEGLILEARDKGLLRFITDIGGGGLSSSVGESAQFSNGVDITLEKVPLKYEGLDAWEIWVSESQERMIIAIDPKDKEEFFNLAKKHDVEVTVIGKYTNSGRLHIEYEGKPVAHIMMDFLKSDFPQWEFEAEWEAPEMRGLREPVLEEPENHGALLLDILARPNICSKEWVIRQYDHEVQGGSVIKPYVGKYKDVNSDAVVHRLVLESMRGLAVTQAINPWLSRIDTYHMTACVIDEAVRRLICVGGDLDHIGGIDNYCWPNIQYDAKTNPDGKYKAAQLVRSCLALRDYCKAFKIPLLSGKDSMYIDGNLRGKYGEIHKISGLPTLLFTACSVIKDVRKCVTMDTKGSGDLVYVLGVTKNELGGSEYYAMFGYIGVNVPKVDMKELTEKLIPMYRALRQAIEEEIVASAHAISRGGLGVHLAQVAFAGGFGMDIDLRKVPTAKIDRNDQILYSESAGRFIVTVTPEDKERFEQLLEKAEYGCIGKTTNDENLKIRGVNGEELINISIYELKEAWQRTFGELI